MADANTQDQLLKRTTLYDTVRACMMSPLNTAFRGSGLAVLVALLYFDAADWQKGILAAVPFIGMLLSPFAVSVVSRAKLPVSKAAAAMTFLAAPGLIVASFARTLPQFMIGVLISVPMLGAVIPLITAMWQQNAPPAVRGRRFSRVTVAGAVTSVISSLFISFWLGDDPGRYRPITGCFAIMVIVAGIAFLQIPSQPLEPSKRQGGGFSIGVFSLVWKDKLFGYLCIAQMLIGFGNLATIPLRTEFLGSDDRGMAYSAGRVMMIAVVIPEISRLLALPLWGRLFDHVNFAVMRMSASSCFVLSLCFTFSTWLPFQIIGSVLFGAGMGGGAIAWSLWVTKLAPAERTADYMSVHTFLTGARGLVAPQVAFLALKVWTVHTVGLSAAAMVAMSVLMLIPVISKFKGRDHA